MSVKIFKSLLISTFALLISTAPIAYAQTTGTVSVSPATQTVVTSGSTFTVAINAANFSGVGSYGFDLVVSNPALVRIDSVTNGTFLGSTGRSVSTLPATIDNSAGRISYGAYTLGDTPAAPNAPSGGSTLATVSFTTLGNGSVTLTLQNTLVSDLNGTSLNLNVANGSVSIGSSAPTPTRTPTPAGPTSTPAARCSTKINGDANCDGVINGTDYSLWLNSQCVPASGQSCANYKADFNADNRVDDTDLSIWTAHRI